MKVLLTVFALLSAFPAFAGDSVEGIWKRTNLDAADPLTPFTQVYLNLDAGSVDSYRMVAKQTSHNNGRYTMVDDTHMLLELTGADPVTFEVRRTPLSLSLCESASDCRTYESVSRIPEFAVGSHSVPAVKMAMTLSCDESSRPTVIHDNLLPTKWESVGIRLYMPITTQCGSFGMTMDFTLLGDDASNIESYATVARVWKRGAGGSWIPTTHKLTLKYLSFGQYAETVINLEDRVFGVKLKPIAALF